MVNADRDFQQWINEGMSLQKEVLRDVMNDCRACPNDITSLHKMTAGLAKGLADDRVISEFDQLDESHKKIVLKAAVHTLMVVEMALRMQAYRAAQTGEQN